MLSKEQRAKLHKSEHALGVSEIHQDKLYTASGFDIKVYKDNGDSLVVEDTFPFPQPIKNIKTTGPWLAVLAGEDLYSISGGPRTEDMYCTLVAKNIKTLNGVYADCISNVNPINGEYYR